jgi:DNA-binding MarR family transcriptional regulator
MTKPVFAASDITARIVTGFEHIGDHIGQLLKAQAMEHKLSPLQIRILIFIHFQEGETRLSMMTGAFKLSKATLSVALKSMEQKRLIHKKIAPDDRRSTSIELTEWGRRIAHVAGFYPEPLKKIIATMSQEEKKALLSVIEGIQHKLDLNA